MLPLGFPPLPPADRARPPLAAACAAPAPRAAAGPTRAFASVEVIRFDRGGARGLGRNRKNRAGEPLSGFRIRPPLAGDGRRGAARRADDRRRARSKRARSPRCCRSERVPSGRCGSPPFSAARTPISAMGLFRPGDRLAARRRSRRCSPPPRGLARPRVDAFLFVNQPRAVAGSGQPLAGAPSQPSPSFAYKSALPRDFAVWRDAHASKEAQKKLRKKVKRLEAMGPLAHRRAADAAEVERIPRRVRRAETRAHARAGDRRPLRERRSAGVPQAPRALRPRRGRAAPGAPRARRRRSHRQRPSAP